LRHGQALFWFGRAGAQFLPNDLFYIARSDLR
jgi:hypothetical protein